MNNKKIIQFEKPIFANEILERNRIFSSEIFFRINLDTEEFWKIFIKYVMKNTINSKEQDLDIYLGLSIQLKDNNGFIRLYTVTKFIKNEVLELSSLLHDDTLNKVSVNTKELKGKNSEICYFESKRTKNTIDSKKWKTQQREFHAKIINKVLVLKNYLLDSIREIY